MGHLCCFYYGKYKCTVVGLFARLANPVELHYGLKCYVVATDSNFSAIISLARDKKNSVTEFQ